MSVVVNLFLQLSHNQGHDVEKLQVLVRTLDKITVNLSDLLENNSLLSIRNVRSFN